jgi:hypothetical protein
LTIVAAYCISLYTKVPFVLSILVLMLLAIIMHRMFCVNTTINKMIFGKVYE